MSNLKICPYCNKAFTSDKKHPYQTICSKRDCQKKRINELSKTIQKEKRKDPVFRENYNYKMKIYLRKYRQL